MGYDADHHIGRVGIRRVEIIKTYDDKGEQFVDAKGLSGETFSEVLVGRNFGSTGVYKEGMVGNVLLAGGRSSKAFLLNAEDESIRPKGNQPGDRFLYDAHGNVISQISGKIRHVSALHELIGDVHIQGNIQIEGNITQAGSITSSGPHTASAHV